MMGARGDAGPDPAALLLGIVADPKATKARIEQLQEATKANEESLEALRTRGAELDARQAELDAMLADIEKGTAALQERVDALDRREIEIVKHEKTAHDLNAAAQVQARAKLKQMDAQVEAVNKVTFDLTAKEEELAAKAKALEEARANYEAVRATQEKRQRELDSREADLAKRMDALKALVA